MRIGFIRGRFEVFVMTGITVLFVSALLHFFSYFLIMYVSTFSFQPFYAPFGLFCCSCLFGNDGTAPLACLLTSIASWCQVGLTTHDQLEPAPAVEVLCNGEAIHNTTRTQTGPLRPLCTSVKGHGAQDEETGKELQSCLQAA